MCGLPEPSPSPKSYWTSIFNEYKVPFMEEDVISAVYKHNEDALRECTAEEVNALDEDGRTALMHAVLDENASTVIVRTLISRGAALDVVDQGQRWTALHFAARDHKEGIVRELLASGASIDPVDVFGNTPLWRTVANSPGRQTTHGETIAVIELLLSYGADPSKKNHTGMSPIDCARQTGDADILVVLEGRPSSDLDEDLKVVHPKFGRGRIIEIHGGSGERKLLVRFEEVGDKLILERFVKRI
jgi:ankyrin repeat protein